jgi:oxygen-dependent protoporphyrinogen oxidase
VRTFVVVGGGMSGMAAARLLSGAGRLSGAQALSGSQASADARGQVRQGDRVVLLEAADRLGGKVATVELPFGPVELGPDQLLRRDPSAESWCRELGLGDRIVAPSGHTAGVFSRGVARALPAGLVLGVPTDMTAVRASGIVSPEASERAEMDEGADGRPISRRELGLEGEEADERSAGAILRARLGDEVVDRLVDPLLGGINAGGVDQLSLSTVAPQVAAALAGEQSVTGALRALVPSSRGAGSPFFAVAGGFGAFVDAAAADLEKRGVDLRLRSPAVAVTFSPDETPTVLLENGEALTTDGVVLAIPAGPAAILLERSVPDASRILAEIPAASVAVVTMAFDRRLDLPAGWTGLLVPRVEDKLTTAVTFLSRKWPWIGQHSAGRSDQTLLRMSTGRFGDDRQASLDDGELCHALRDELAELLGVTAEPVGCHVQRWDGAFPQYLPGHRVRMLRVAEALAPTPVALAGALLGGIGVPACVSSGEAAAQRVLLAASRQAV